MSTLRHLEYIIENVPATLEELPNEEVSARDRAAGVQVFRLRYRDGGSGNSYGHQLTQIYHLDRDRQAVVCKFLEESPNFVEDFEGNGLDAAGEATVRFLERIGDAHEPGDHVDLHDGEAAPVQLVIGPGQPPEHCHLLITRLKQW